MSVIGHCGPVLVFVTWCCIRTKGEVLCDTTLFISPVVILLTVSIRLFCCSSSTKTCLYNVDPLKPHFYIVKLEFTGVYIIFLISAQKHRMWVLVGTASPSYKIKFFI